MLTIIVAESFNPSLRDGRVTLVRNPLQRSPSASQQEVSATKRQPIIIIIIMTSLESAVISCGGDQVIAAGIAAIPREIQFNERTRGKTWNGFPIYRFDSHRGGGIFVEFVCLHWNMQQRESLKFCRTLEIFLRFLLYTLD